MDEPKPGDVVEVHHRRMRYLGGGLFELADPLHTRVEEPLAKRFDATGDGPIGAPPPALPDHSGET